MIGLLQLISAATTQENYLETFNAQISQHLNSTADSDHFSKIKMAFTDKCPTGGKKCTLSSCNVPRIKFEGSDGYIDLSTVIESYSSTSRGGSAVWARIYSLIRNNDILERAVSGLHFSVTTHIASKHTVILGRYFSNPLLFRRRYRKEYKDNFLYLYMLVREAVAKLERNGGEIPAPTMALSRSVRRLMRMEFEQMKQKVPLLETGGRSLLDQNRLKDVENLEDGGIAEQSSTDEFMGMQVGKEHLETLNEMVKEVGCLECQKCKLWGTIQVKGIKSAVKVLNGMPLFKNEVIFLVNLMRQLSYTMAESRRLEDIRIPQLCVLAVCHRQLLMLVFTTLGVVFGTLKVRQLRSKK